MTQPQENNGTTSQPAIYLDHAAAAPLCPAARAAMEPHLQGITANPNAIHRAGRAARRAIETARAAIAHLIGAHPRELIFTSGGTEANNLALLGILEAAPSRRPRVILSAVEHHSVLHTAHAAARLGAQIELLPVDQHGIVHPDSLAHALRQPADLVSIMHGNNETGALQPIFILGALCHDHGVHFHIDAAQSAAFLPLDTTHLPADLLTLSAHKLGGPKGAGALWVRHGVSIAPLLHGGPQERGKRPGTENVAALAGFGAAAQDLQDQRTTRAAHCAALRDQFEATILATIPGVTRNGPENGRLPHISNLRFDNLEAENLLYALDEAGIMASAGSACTSGSLDPSHVLLAMGQDHPTARAALRFSVGPSTTQAEIEAVARALPPLVEEARNAPQRC